MELKSTTFSIPPLFGCFCQRSRDNFAPFAYFIYVCECLPKRRAEPSAHRRPGLCERVPTRRAEHSAHRRPGVCERLPTLRGEPSAHRRLGV
jgi:hypothetical protein